MTTAHRLEVRLDAASWARLQRLIQRLGTGTASECVRQALLALDTPTTPPGATTPPTGPTAAVRPAPGPHGPTGGTAPLACATPTCTRYNQPVLVPATAVGSIYCGRCGGVLRSL